jgi:hypothetical protein
MDARQLVLVALSFHFLNPLLITGIPTSIVHTFATFPGPERPILQR